VSWYLALTISVDFGNNTLVVPPPDAPESVSCILYYSDVDECMGPTAFKLRAEHFGDNPAEPSWRVAKHGSVGAGPSDLLAPDELVETALDSRNFTTHRTAQQRPDIYADEQAVRYRPGTALLYRMGEPATHSIGSLNLIVLTTAGHVMSCCDAVRIDVCALPC
jgi:hypothetical protein